jgi:DNA-directed RNA polymerase subunit RPC12/RpoP
MTYICTDCSSAINQLKKLSSTITARYLFYGMCITIANIGGVSFPHRDSQNPNENTAPQIDAHTPQSSKMFQKAQKSSKKAPKSSKMLQNAPKSSKMLFGHQTVTKCVDCKPNFSRIKFEALPKE